jgi:hypothetical protein
MENKYVYLSITANVVLLSVAGYLFNRGPAEQVVTKVIEEKVVTKVEVQTVTEYKDRIVYKDRVVVERITTPDGTVTERTVAESEGSKDTSVSTATNSTATASTTKVDSTSAVNNPTKLSRYSLGVDYSIASSVKSLTPEFTYDNVTVEADARIGNLPVFIGIFARLDGGMYGLGLRMEL